MLCKNYYKFCHSLHGQQKCLLPLSLFVFRCVLKRQSLPFSPEWFLVCTITHPWWVSTCFCSRIYFFCNTAWHGMVLDICKSIVNRIFGGLDKLACMWLWLVLPSYDTFIFIPSMKNCALTNNICSEFFTYPIFQPQEVIKGCWFQSFFSN